MKMHGTIRYTIFCTVFFFFVACGHEVETEVSVNLMKSNELVYPDCPFVFDELKKGTLRQDLQCRALLDVLKNCCPMVVDVASMVKNFIDGHYYKTVVAAFPLFVAKQAQYEVIPELFGSKKQHKEIDGMRLGVGFARNGAPAILLNYDF